MIISTSTCVAANGKKKIHFFLKKEGSFYNDVRTIVNYTQRINLGLYKDQFKVNQRSKYKINTIKLFRGKPSKTGVRWRVHKNDIKIAMLKVELLGEGNGNPLQYSCLENPRDGGAWWAIVHGVAKSLIRLSDFTFTFNPQLRRVSGLVFAIDCFLEFWPMTIFFLSCMFSNCITLHTIG